MKCRIKEIKNTEEIGRILVVSDIHGCVHYLEGVLKKAGYTPQDTLVIVGDMIEKGPESLKTVRCILDLQKENPKVYAVMGNVDCHRVGEIYNDSPEGMADFLGTLKWTKRVWKRGLFLDMLEELGIDLEKIREEDMPQIRVQIRQHFSEELEFMWNLPTILSLGKYLFVHAGVPTDCLSELEKTDAFGCMKIDAFLDTARKFEKTVVVGHWPVSLYRTDVDSMNPIFDYEKRIISIDGGCALKYGEQLNALLIPGPDADMEEVTYIAYDDYPVLIAAKAQKARARTITIRYFDCEVELLEDLGDLVLLRQISSGRTFRAPKHFLYFNGGKTFCSDINDECLAVETGDKLSVVAETSDGYIVKKDGVMGWYRP